jgi:hypothetical protein
LFQVELDFTVEVRCRSPGLTVSLQYLGLEKPFEKWGSYMTDFKRFLRLLGDLQVPAVMLLSGDVHYAQFYELPPPCSSVGYSIYEFCSSGMTHTCQQVPLDLCRRLGKSLLGAKYAITDIYVEKNYGTIEVDWDGGTVRSQIRNEEGTVVMEKLIDLKTLRYNASKIQMTDDCWPTSIFAVEQKTVVIAVYAVGVILLIGFLWFFITLFRCARSIYRKLPKRKSE